MRTGLGALLVGAMLLQCGHAPSLATYTFGLSLTTSANSELFTLLIVKEFKGEVIGTEPIGREQFMMQAQGAVPSRANPEGVNLMRLHDVSKCVAGGPSDAIVLRDCAVLDDLWKLRFWEYPFLVRDGHHHGKGWAEKREAPSPRQLLLLSGYGIEQLGRMAKGDDVFRLLHDMCDEAWVDNYRKGY